MTSRPRPNASCVAALVCGLALTSWAGAPQGRYTVTADTVFDTKTSLTWQRSAPSALYTQANAAAYCQSLGLGGMTGWRLPTIKELQSLVDIRTSKPAIDAAVFPGTASNEYWSSSSFAINTSYAWTVTFSYGNVNSGPVTNDYLVRCVR